MTEGEKAVFDTNVYLSAILFGSKPRQLLLLALRGKFSLIISPAILLEIAQKLATKFRWSEERIQVVIKAIADIAQIVNPKEKVLVVKDDPSDNKIIEAALAGGAKFIITGDHHLLKIGSYRKIKILTPSEYFKKLF